jgi:hypothetical protein
VRRPERAAAAALLVVLLSSLWLLARPEGGAAAAGPAAVVKESTLVRFCGSPAGSGDTVQIGLESDKPVNVQIAYGTNLPPGVFPTTFSGGQLPSQVTLPNGQMAIPVELAGTVGWSNQVVVQQLDNYAVQTFAIDTIPCSTGSSGLTIPAPSSIDLANPAYTCDSGNNALVTVVIAPAAGSYSSYLNASHLSDVQYNVVLVGSTGAAFAASAPGSIVPDPNTGLATVPATPIVSVPAGVAGDYQVEVVGADGIVLQATPSSVALSCPITTPSTGPGATTTVTTTVTETTTATATATATMTDTTSPTAPPPTFSQDTTASGPTASTATRTTVVTSTAQTTATATATMTLGTTLSPGAIVSVGAGGTVVRTLTNLLPQATITLTGSAAREALVGSTLGPNSAISANHLSWHNDAAIVVAIDALAIGALVGATVWSVRRR